MRSSAGVGMTPPKVEGAAKPTSSVMMSRMFGAPFGGATRGGHQGFDCASVEFDLAPEFRRRRRQHAAVDRRRGVGRSGAPVVCSRFGVTGAAGPRNAGRCCALARAERCDDRHTRPAKSRPRRGSGSRASLDPPPPKGRPIRKPVSRALGRRGGRRQPGQSQPNLRAWTTHARRRLATPARGEAPIPVVIPSPWPDRPIRRNILSAGPRGCHGLRAPSFGHMRKTRERGCKPEPGASQGRRDRLYELGHPRRSRPGASRRSGSAGFVALPAALRGARRGSRRGSAGGRDRAGDVRRSRQRPALCRARPAGRGRRRGDRMRGVRPDGLCATGARPRRVFSGLVALHAPTVREALRVLAEGLKTSDTGGAVAFAERGGEASLGYVVTAPDMEIVGPDRRRRYGDRLSTPCAQLCGPAWRPREVRLNAEGRRGQSPFLRLFEAPVAFGARRPPASSSTPRRSTRPCAAAMRITPKSSRRSMR